MDQIAPLILSREAFDRWANEQPSGRFERVHGEVVRLPAEIWEHVSLKAAIYRALDAATTGPDIQIVMDGLAIGVDDHDFLPDVTVHVGAPIPRKAKRVPNPVVVIEVLSASTTRIDTTVKLEGYFRVPSVLHYLVFRADKRLLLHWRRGREAPSHPAIGPLTLDPPDLTIDLAAIYDRAGVA